MALVRFLRHGAAGSVQDRSGSRVSIGPLRQPGGDRRQMEPDTAAVCAGVGYARNIKGQLYHVRPQGSRAGPGRPIYGQEDWPGARGLGLQMQGQRFTSRTEFTERANSGHNPRSGQPEHCLGFSKAGRRGLSLGSGASGVVPPQG